MRISIFFCTFARYFNFIMRKTLRLITILAVTAVACSSCVTQKKLTYLRDVNAQSADSINKYFEPSAEVTIKPGDAITIFVSALDQEAVAPYNLPTVAFNDPTTDQVKTTPMLLTYRVDEHGDIEMPVLGKLHVEGLVRAETEQLIKTGRQ